MFNTIKMKGFGTWHNAISIYLKKDHNTYSNDQKQNEHT